MKCKLCNRETKVDWWDGKDYVICPACKGEQERPIREAKREAKKKKRDALEFDPKRINTRIYLILTSLTAIVFGICGLVPAIMSGMIFDAPGSENSVINWIIFLCMFSFPPICLLSIVLSWTTYASQAYKSARIVALLPLANIAILVCLWAFGSIIAFSDHFQTLFTKEHKEKVAYVESICREDRIIIHKRAKSRAKSIYFPQDRLRPHETWFLWNQDIDFIETRRIGEDGNFEYMKIEKDTTPTQKGESNIPTISTTIEEPQAEYEVFYNHITKKFDKRYSIYGKEFIIKNRTNNEVLANFSYVSIGGKGGKRCPPMKISGVHTIRYVLGIMNNEEAKTFEKQLTKYHKSKK